MDFDPHAINLDFEALVSSQTERLTSQLVPKLIFPKILVIFLPTLLTVKLAAY